MVNGTDAVYVREFSPVLFVLRAFYVLALWHNTKVGIIGAVHVREFSPISNYFMYYAFIL